MTGTRLWGVLPLMDPTLVVLAAGMGSRYGGLKQMEPVGPSGETLLDYGVYDAIHAGFTRVVFVVGRDFREGFVDPLRSKYAGKIEVESAVQALDSLPAGSAVPAGRTKPLGTGHAVWCARPLLSGPFAVINADDFYGARAFQALAQHLAGAADGDFCLVGYPLGETLSEYGAVSRGICREQAGRLVAIEERTGITPTDVGPGGRFSGSETVSMNCWGFTPAVLEGLDSGLKRFLSGPPSPGSEFYLPTAVSAMIEDGAAGVRVLKEGRGWFGVTYREDRPKAVAAIRALVARCDYPERLFG